MIAASIELFLYLSAIGGMLFTLVCFLDWLCDRVKKHFKEKDNV